MGKKKSVVLLVLISIVLVALVFMSVASFAVPSTVKNFNSFLSVIDLGTDLGGGYQTVMYPEGVISAEEYEELTEANDPSVSDYKAHKGVYLSSDWFSGQELNAARVADFETAVKTINERYENKGFSDYNFHVQDDFTIVAGIPKTDEDPDNVFEKLVLSDKLVFKNSANSKELAGEEIVKSVEVQGMDNTWYVVLNFTKSGRGEFEEFTKDIASAASDSSTPSLYVYMGDEQLMNVQVSEAIDEKYVAISGYTTESTAKTVAVVLETALYADKIFEYSFTTSVAAEFEATMGESAALIIAIAFGALIVAMAVAFIVRYKGMGVAHVYGFITFAVIYIMCLALIDGIQLSMGGVLAVLLASIMCVACNLLIFKNIADDFYSGKTVTSAVKSGYRKTIAFTIDIHAILLIAALIVWLISSATVKFVAMIFLLGVAISAATTLLFTRFYFYLLLSAAKNKIAFCNFKREELEDE